MVESMDEISRMAADNARVIGGSTSTSKAQVASMTRMVSSSQELNGLAEKMYELLRRFETGRTQDRSGF